MERHGGPGQRALRVAAPPHRGGHREPCLLRRRRPGRDRGTGRRAVACMPARSAPTTGKEARDARRRGRDFVPRRTARPAPDHGERVMEMWPVRLLRRRAACEWRSATPRPASARRPGRSPGLPTRRCQGADAPVRLQCDPDGLRIDRPDKVSRSARPVARAGLTAPARAVPRRHVDGCGEGPRRPQRPTSTISARLHLPAARAADTFTVTSADDGTVSAWPTSHRARTGVAAVRHPTGSPAMVRGTASLGSPR